MRHVIGFIVGGIAFAAAHAIEARHWSDWFRGSYEPRFLNSGRAALFTLAVLWVVCAALAALNRSRHPVRGVAAGGGAFVAMAVLLFSGPGPGTLFPIVLAAGGAARLCSSLAGARGGPVILRKGGAAL